MALLEANYDTDPLLAVAQILAGADPALGLGSLNTNIFVGRDASTITAGICLTLGGGSIDPAVPEHQHVRFGLVVKDPSYAAGFAKAKRAAGLLVSQVAVSVGAITFHCIHPRSQPVPIGQDQSTAFLFYTTFDAVYFAV